MLKVVCVTPRGEGRQDHEPPNHVRPYPLVSGLNIATIDLQINIL